MTMSAPRYDNDRDRSGADRNESTITI
jgi:hypothetical protein